MASSPSWRPLPVPPSSGLPVLLVSTAFTRNSYVIHVTDMANMWSESMDRKAIVLRSLEEEPSIDPTDSSQNMLEFLAKIRSALDPSDAGHDAARVTLSASGSQAGDKTADYNEQDGSLTLRITCEIPELPLFSWPVYLKKSPPSQLGTELVIPLLQTSLDKSRKIDSLLETIRQKDAVVTKLLDKLEATGTRLEHIFTALTSRQKVSRKTAEEKVAGLASFDRTSWESHLGDQQDAPRDVAELASSVFGRGTGLEYNSGIDICDSPALNDWWTKLSENTSIPLAGGKTHPNQERSQAPSAGSKAARDQWEDEADRKDDDDDDDDFQVQSTPPHLSSTRKRAENTQTKQHGAEESTEEDKPKAAPSGNKQPARPGRIGAISGKERRPPTRSPSPPHVPPPAQAQEGSETESEADDDPTMSHASSSPTPVTKATSNPSPKKGGLGRIGGAKKAEPEPPKSKFPGAETASPRKPARMIGQIGKKPSTEPSEEDGRGEGRGRPAGRESEAKPRETSEERANRKRDELQKELEKKAAAGPSRKKRKF